MFSSELVYFLALSVVFLSAPYLPTTLLLLLDHLLVRVVMIIGLLFLIRIGPTAGIFGLMAIAVLYVERNRRKVTDAVKRLDAMDPETPSPALLPEVLSPQHTVPVKEFDSPHEEESFFVPHEEDSSSACDDNHSFEPVAPSINQKGVLSTVYPFRGAEGSASSAAELFEELGMGHLRGVETVS